MEQDTKTTTDEQPAAVNEQESDEINVDEQNARSRELMDEARRQMENASEEDFPRIDPQTVADDLRTLFSKYLEPEKLEAAVANITGAPAPSLTAADDAPAPDEYKAHGRFLSFVFYTNLALDIEGAEFMGDAGVFTEMGVGVFFGTVFTKDVQRLIDQTASFSYFAARLYITVHFWDKDHNFLGHLQAGAISWLAGGGGGSGSWKRK
ncbi:MAG: VapA/VapB family virulence-associated protein [Acidobacteriota bacterium]|nr:VapA/VapB family virulence-associated protein [Acidobacteriota bacterium]